MAEELTPTEILERTRFAFRGTDRDFYEYQLAQSKYKFGKKGLYSAGVRGVRKLSTSVTLNPHYATFYASNANKRAKDEFTRYLNGNLIQSNPHPIVLVISLDRYKDRMKKGLEWDFDCFEYEILSPIKEEDIKILTLKDLDNIESFLTEIPRGIIGHSDKSIKEFLKRKLFS